MSDQNITGEEVKKSNTEQLSQSKIEKQIEDLKKSVFGSVQDFTSYKDYEYEDYLQEAFNSKLRDDLGNLVIEQTDLSNNNQTLEAKIKDWEVEKKSLKENNQYQITGKEVYDMPSHVKRDYFLYSSIAILVLLIGYFVNARQIYADIQDDYFYAYFIPLLLFIGSGWAGKAIFDRIAKKPKHWEILWLSLIVIMFASGFGFLYLLTLNPKGENSEFIFTIRILASYIFELSLANVIYGHAAKIKEDHKNSNGTALSAAALSLESQIEAAKKDISENIRKVASIQILIDMINNAKGPFIKEAQAKLVTAKKSKIP